MDENENKKQCSGPECTRSVRACGLCATHYQQQYVRGMELIPIGSWKKPSRDGCSFEDCTRKHYARGWCFAHYSQARNGVALHPTRKNGKAAVCSAEGCEKKHCAKGWCKNHYKVAQRRLKKQERAEEK